MIKNEQNPVTGKRTIEVKEPTREEFTRSFFSPELQAAVTETLTCDKGLNEGIDSNHLLEEISKGCDAVNAGDMKLAERIAFSQAHTLNHLFNRMTQIAFANLSSACFEPFMRLAFRAQAQSARTLETLAALKNPTIFAKQLNVANQQIVNNGSASPAQVADGPATLNEPVPIVPFAKSEIPAPAHERMER